VTRLSLLNSPLLLGFEQFERTLDNIAKASTDGYPPYNIERVGDNGLRITLAVAGFSRQSLTVFVEDNKLVIRGKQEDDKDRVYLHRGIASRQFQRSFMLADGIEVTGASLDNGLLCIELERPVPSSRVRTIDISQPVNNGADKTSAQTIDVGPER
jgi:HSP20 family molecular chaperone IbpA